MTRKTDHYEQAFEDFLRSRGWPYVSVDQAKKAIFADASLKSFDFVVYSDTGPNLLVDVKGRKFPDLQPGRRQCGLRAWENWITVGDVHGLEEWQKVFGVEFQALLVFAYWLQGPPQYSPFVDLHWFRKRHYGFVGIPLLEYARLPRPSASGRCGASPGERTPADGLGRRPGFLPRSPPDRGFSVTRTAGGGPGGGGPCAGSGGRESSPGA